MLAIIGSGALQAAEPQVEATLSDNSVELGEQVELQIKITGAHDIKPPENISIDGLNIGGVSQSSQHSISIINGSFSSTETTVFTFPIIPQKTGEFTIPPLTIESDGKKITTQPIKLTVTGGSTNPGNASAGTGNPDEQQTESNGEIASAELIVPKQSAYLGEAIPVELRVYFNAQVQVQFPPGSVPQIKTEGFTMQRLAEPQQKQFEKNHKIYNCLIFKTVVTPAKTGILTIGPAEMPFVAVVPVKRKMQRQRTGGPFDAMLNDPFFNGMMNMAEQRNFTARGASVDLDVKPLPIAGKPKSFDGAIGQFKMETSAKPLKASIGDPITMTTNITGRGNFDRVNAPVMTDETGWRSYPPSSKFTADDNAGISGTKTFDMALIPQEKKSSLPGTEFSYFDPATEKYVTLTSTPQAIAVEGQNPPLVAQTAPAQQTGAGPSPTPQSRQKTDDILYIADTAHWGESIDPLYLRRDFWLAQIVPAAALLAFAGFRLRSLQKNNVEAARVAALEKEKGECLKVLNRIGTGHAEFFEAAVRYIQAETARTTGRNPASIGVDDAIASHELVPATKEGVQSIFSASAEQRFAGGSGTGGSVPDGKRDKVLATIRSFENV